MLMACMLIFGGRVCEGYNAERKARNERNGLEDLNKTEGFMEGICLYQDLAVG